MNNTHYIVDVLTNMTYLFKMANLCECRYFVPLVLSVFITFVLYTIKNKPLYVMRNTIVLNVVRYFCDTFTSALMFSERNLSQLRSRPSQLSTLIEPRMRIAHRVLQLFRMLTRLRQRDPAVRSVISVVLFIIVMSSLYKTSCNN